MAASVCFLLSFNLIDWRYNTFFELLLYNIFHCNPFLFDLVVTYFNIPTKTWTRGCFLEDTKFNFFIVAKDICFAFLY